MTDKEKTQLKRLQGRIEELEAERTGLREALKGSEDRLRFIYDSSPLGMGFIDMDGVMADCNAALADILGVPRERLVGFQMRSEVRDEGMAVAIARAFAGTPSAFEGEYAAAPGERKIVLRAIFTPLSAGDGVQKGVLFLAENITERKGTEDLLRESESRYKAIVESQAEFVARYLRGGTLTFVNDTMCRYLGVKREDLLGRSYYSFMHPGDRDAFIGKIEALDRDRPSVVAEARVVLPDGRVTWHRWAHHAVFDGSGKLVEYQCTGRDVTELRDAEERLRQSEELYRQLYEAESDAIFLVDNERGRILMANSAAAAMYGYSIEELLSMENNLLSAEPEKTRKVTTETPVLKDNVVYIPLRFHRKKDGTVFPVEVTGRFFHLRGRPVHISACRDISKRNEAEEAVRRQAELLDLTHDAIFVRDKDDRIAFWNRGAEICYGWTAAEALGQVSHELLRTRFPLPLGDIVREVSEMGFWDGVLEHHTKDGRSVTVMSRWSLRRAHGDVPFGILELNVDISERRRAEAALGESERKYKFLVETTDTGFVILDEEGRVLDANDEYVRLSGHASQQEMLGRKVSEWTAAHDRERNAAEVKNCLERGGVRNLEIDYVHGDGTLVPVEINATVMRDKGAVRIFGLCRDISRRKAADAQLRESEGRLRTVTENAPDTILQVDRQGTITFVNRPVPGMTAEQIVGTQVYRWVPQDNHAVVREALEQVFTTGQRQEYQSAGPGPDGEVRFYNVRVMPVVVDGKAESAIYIATDVTEQKRAEQTVAERGAVLQQIQDAASVAIFLVDREGRISHANRRMAEMFGCSIEELVGSEYVEHVHPSERETGRMNMLALLANKIHSVDLERRYRRKDGSEFWGHLAGRRFQDVQGNDIGLIGVITDITGRKRAEEELRGSEERFREAMAFLPTPIGIAGKDGNIVYFNTAFTEHYGYRLEDTPTLESWYERAYPDPAYRKRVVGIWEEDVAAAMRDGSSTPPREYRITCKDGARKDVEIVMRPVGDRWICSFSDVTERNQAVKALRESEAMLRQSQHVAHLGHYVFDVPSGTWNSSGGLDEIFGIGPDHPRDVQGWLQIVHAEQRDAMARYLREEVLRDGKPFDREYRITRPSDGADRWVHGLGNLEFDADGREVKMFGTIQDITDRKEAAEALKAGEMKYRRLYNETPVMLHSIDRNGILVDVNDHWLGTLGFERDAVIGRKVTDFYSETSRKYATEVVQPAFFRDGFVRDASLQFLKKNGDVVDVLLTATGERDGEGNVVRSQAVIQDITERKRAEERLRESEEKYRTIFEGAAEGVALADIVTRRLLYVNPAYCDMYGYTKEEMARLGVENLHPRSALPHVIAEFEAQARGEKVLAPDLPCLRKDGSVFYADVKTTTIDLGGKQAVVGFFTDITERRLAAERTRKYSADLQRLLSVSREMTATTDLDRLYRSAVQTAADLLRFNFSTVMVLSDDGTRLTIMDAVGFPPSAVGRSFPVDGEGLSTYAVRTKKTERVADFLTESRFRVPLLVREHDIRSALCVPMMIGEDVFGVLIGHTRAQREFSEEDVAVYENIGSQAAIAIKNAMNLQSLGKSERMLKTIIDAEPECVKLLDRDANLLLMNRSGLDMVQAGSLDEVRGKCICPMIGDADRDEFMDLTRRVFEGESGTLTFEMTGIKGRQLWMETHAVPLRNEKDEIIALLGVTRDVTARKKADEALRASEERFRDLAESLPLTVFEMDRQGRFTYLNRAALETFGYGQKDVEAGLFMMQLVNPQDRERAREMMIRRLEGDREGHSDYRGMRKDGSTFPIMVESSTILHDGRPAGLRGIVLDLTDRRTLEEEQLKSQKLESIGTLAGGIAHDFNNLLQGLFGYLSLARLTFDDRAKSLAMVEQAERALHQAMGLTSQLLTFSKGGKPVRKRISFGPVIQNAAKFALAGSRSESRLEIEQGLWWIDGDSGQLGQVVQNLVLNADQAMPLGGVVEITARNIAGDDPMLPQAMAKRDHVMVSVRDSGVGIPEGYLSRVFDPYFTTKEKGSGLGLATSYSIIRNHDGLLTVQSEQGKGSMFTIWLPSAGPGEELSAAAPAVTGLRKGRILVLDDEDVVRNVAEELLRELGHEAATVANGEAAIEAFRKAREAGRPFDVVVLDLTIRGGMGGIDTLRVLREIDPGVKAVVSSGYSDGAAVSEQGKYGFRAFLRKPYNVKELQDILATLLA